jgi:hypothetical protein
MPTRALRAAAQVFGQLCQQLLVLRARELCRVSFQERLDDGSVVTGLGELQFLKMVRITRQPSVFSSGWILSLDESAVKITCTGALTWTGRWSRTYAQVPTAIGQSDSIVTASWTRAASSCDAFATDFGGNPASNKQTNAACLSGSGS